jgi:hypothetical protein
MTDVSALQSVAERLARIANDCFDLRAVERLRDLVDELQAVRNSRNASSGGIPKSQDPIG